MEQHPIPRQITTFEFKLIGFLTLRQFIFIAVFSALGVIFYYGVPIPVMNIAATAGSVLVGIALAYIRVNERPLDVFLKNFVRKLFAPSQYYYRKSRQLSPLADIPSSTLEEIVQTHLEARRKLNQYLAQKTDADTENQPPASTPKSSVDLPKTPTRGDQPTTTVDAAQKTPFLAGLVANSKNVPLPGILIYVKDAGGKLIRILKSNPAGRFATFHPLSAGNYTLEVKDPKKGYFFDTLKISFGQDNGQNRSLTITSKELL